MFPLLERLQTQWETLRADDEYEPVHAALDAGLVNMQKWYQKPTIHQFILYLMVGFFKFFFRC